MAKREKKRHGIRILLVLTYVFTGIIPLFLLSNVVFSTTEKYYIEERKKELLNQANILSGHIVISNYMFDKDKAAEFTQDIAQTSSQGDFRIIVTDSMGTVVNDSNKTEINKTYLIPEVIEALDNKDVAREQPNGSIYAVASIVDSTGENVGAVLIADMPTDIKDRMEVIRKQVYIMTIAIVLIVLIIVFIFSQMITEPIEKMVKTISQMADGHLERRIQVSNLGQSEIMELGVAVNNMAEKLEQVDISRQQFVSNVSHELKTPLSSIKVLSESMLLNTEAPREMYVEFLQDINSEIDRMTEIINDLLTLVRLDQKEIPVNFKTERLNNIVGDIVKRLMPLAQKKNIVLEYEEVQEVIAEIDSMKFTLAVSNLVDNAIKYTDEGGHVKVILDCDHQNAFITVSDTGVGIADDEIGRIFDRFYRVDKTRDRETGGTGLGLSITHSTILMHNGSIKVSSRENEGTTFVVRIPLMHSKS
ncbi:HAMP domain-containing histidine kinase [Anaerotignum faecicola]|nr:HAMP domain-containing histidine kinase [Anaerotignum faecicola]